jgi:hypothetical protein
MSGWRDVVKLSEVARGPVSATLAPDDAIRAQIAKELGLESLPALKGELTVRPWLDGAEITGRFKARVEQVCGVSAEPFEQEVEGAIGLRVVPAGSPHAPADSEHGDVALDLAAYLIEHLALEIDPFPRKPGATFDYTPDAPEESPFAVLKRLKGEGE